MQKRLNRKINGTLRFISERYTFSFNPLTYFSPSPLAPRPSTSLGVTTLGVTTLGVTTLGVTTLGVTTLGVTTLGVTTLGVTTPTTPTTYTTYPTFTALQLYSFTALQPPPSSPSSFLKPFFTFIRDFLTKSQNCLHIHYLVLRDLNTLESLHTIKNLYTQILNL
jgi:hypothetical protein